MSHSLSQSQSTAPPTQNLTDFTALAAMFQDIAHLLLRYGERSEIEKSEAERSSQKGQVEQLKQPEQTEQTKHINQAKQTEQAGQIEQAECINKKEQDEQSKQVGQTGQAKLREQSKQTEQTSQAKLREQSINFSYDINGERTPAFSKIYADIIGGYERGEFHDEIRCFHICASSVSKEYQLLDKYNCINLNEFLHKTYAELSIIINLLSYLDKNMDLPVTELHQVCRNLFNSLDKLQELHRHLKNLQLVHKAIIPA